MEGVFDLSEDVIKIIEGEALTFAMVAAIAELARQIVKDPARGAQAVRSIEAISPRIGAKFRKYLSSPVVIGWLGVFFTALPLALNYMIPDQQPECVVTRV